MTTPTRDPRLTPARDDLAAVHLRGEVEAARFVSPERKTIISPVTPLRTKPGSDAIDTELLFGEQVDVYDTSDGSAWVQSARDGYVGYISAQKLDEMPEPTHVVQTLGAGLSDTPTLKVQRTARLPFGAQVTVTVEEDGYGSVQTRGDGTQRWIAMQCLRPLDNPEPDWVAIAERFLGVPYYWGGRSSRGLDCSGLVQTARHAAGQECPRDSDMQQAALGRTLDPNEPTERGDLIFWKGHVGIVAGPNLLLHANAHHMCVATEALDAALDRIGRAEFGQVTRRARLDA
ncbi:MAG: NlpC/P60 family protein [Pseudomonadota bacterium]